MNGWVKTYPDKPCLLQAVCGTTEQVSEKGRNSSEIYEKHTSGAKAHFQ